MSPAAGAELPSDRAPEMSAFSGNGSLKPAQKDKVIEWYMGEFAAANAIIDALCHHLVQISGGGKAGEKSVGDPVPEEYEAALAAIHWRRLNWIPVLQMQKYFTIADVAVELRKAATRRRKKVVEDEAAEVVEKREKMMEEEDGDMKSCNGNDNGNGNGNGGVCISEGEDSPDSEITDTGSHEVQTNIDHIEICDNHEDCAVRREQIKLTKGFVAKEPVKGHMVNVVKGLKLYEDLFTDLELSKLNDFVDELRAAGENGHLLGETYILFNKQMKGNKREQIQLGVPIFGQVKDDAVSQEHKTNIEDIPALLQSVIEHLVQWKILPENRRPNGCVINYFDEAEYSQPFLKPPHLDQPLCTLVLYQSTMAFGRTLVNDGDGNFKGNLMLSLKDGSVMVMRNNSADMARHVICASPTKRVCITFTRVRPDTVHSHHVAAPLSPAMVPFWQHGNRNSNPMDIVIPNPKWGLTHAPMVMLSPVVMNPRRIPQGGTGVFLPWAVRSTKQANHLPPRAQKRQVICSDTMSDPGFERRMM